MITLLKSYIANPTGKDNIIKSRAVMKLAGLSTDEKPLIKFKDIEIENGSSFVEIDTSKVYKYDEENNEWIEQVKGSNKDIIIENNALLTYINEITGGNDNNLSDAIHTLITIPNFNFPWVKKVETVIIEENNATDTLQCQSYFLNKYSDASACFLLDDPITEGQLICMMFSGVGYRTMLNDKSKIQKVVLGGSWTSKILEGTQYMLLYI